MTALAKYARIEATGLWRATPDVQRREVIVSIGDATLVITDLKDQALAHWSLAAVERGNAGETPALYHPDGDAGETLELPASEAEMIEAIETLRRTISRSRPRPGRLRGLGMVLSVLAVGALAVFWLPGALQDHTLTVVPDVKRAQIGAALLRRIERVSGPRCTDPAGMAALALLSQRLDAGQIAVLPNMTRPSLNLPGKLILLDRTVLEDHEEPDVAAGYAITELTRRDIKDPLRHLLENTGIWENFRLVTTGEISPDALDAYAQYLMTTDRAKPELARHTARFANASLRSTPYARARDITGESTLDLIEGDPMNGKLTEPLMSDPNWLRLQNICGG
jgi:anti-sigma factor RsiW